MYDSNEFSTSSNRFIFSDDFYNNLENNIEEKEDVVAANTVNISIPVFESNNNDTVNNISTGVVEKSGNSFLDSNDTSIKNDFLLRQADDITSNINENQNFEIDDQNDLSDNSISSNIIDDYQGDTKPDLGIPTIDEYNLLNNNNNNNIISEKDSLIDNNYNSNSINNINSPKVNKPDLGIPTIDEYNLLKSNDDSNEKVDLQPASENSIPIYNQSEFDVSTGIDTKLEQQLINNSAEYEPVEEFNPFLYREEPKEKNVYRANRKPKNGVQFGQNVNMQSNPVQRPMQNDYVEINNDIIKQEKIVEPEEDDWVPDSTPAPVFITEEVDYTEPTVELEATKSNLLQELREKEKQTGKISILARYGDDFCSRDYVTNPAIGRDNEIKELGLILLTPEKSAILVGKPGIGKTSIVEGLAYRIQRNLVPDALKGFRVVSVKTTSLLGSLPSGETRLQTLIDELKELDKIILFVDEIHMLMGATNESSLDFANMFKESLGRGNIKMIGATTTDEYERYVLRDKAFVRRFQRVDVKEPTRDQTIEILMGTLPKIEKSTGAKLAYTHYIQSEIMAFIVDITTEYKRIYGIGSRYPDICITLVSQAFSNCVFDNRNEVNILDIRDAIEHSKNIYPDVIKKELINFDNQFKNLIDELK